MERQEIEDLLTKEFEYKKKIAELEEEINRLKTYKILLAEGLKENHAIVAMMLIKLIRGCVMLPSLIIDSLTTDIPSEVMETLKKYLSELEEEYE